MMRFLLASLSNHERSYHSIRIHGMERMICHGPLRSPNRWRLGGQGSKLSEPVIIGSGHPLSPRRLVPKKASTPIDPRQFLIHNIEQPPDFLATKFGPPKSYKLLGTVWVLKGITTLPSSWHPTDPVIGTVCAMNCLTATMGQRCQRLEKLRDLTHWWAKNGGSRRGKKCWKMISFSAVWKFEHGPSMSQPWRVVAQVNFNDLFVFNVLCVAFFKHCFCIMRFTQAKTRDEIRWDVLKQSHGFVGSIHTPRLGPGCSQSARGKSAVDWPKHPWPCLGFPWRRGLSVPRRKTSLTTVVIYKDHSMKDYGFCSILLVITQKSLKKTPTINRRSIIEIKNSSIPTHFVTSLHPVFHRPTCNPALKGSGFGGDPGAVTREVSPERRHGNRSQPVTFRKTPGNKGVFFCRHHEGKPMVDVSEFHWGHIDTLRDTMLGLRNPWVTWGDSMICLGHSAKLLDVAWEMPQLWSWCGLVPFKTFKNMFYGFCLGWLFVRVFQQLFHQNKGALLTNLVTLSSLPPLVQVTWLMVLVQVAGLSLQPQPKIHWCNFFLNPWYIHLWTLK